MKFHERLRMVQRIFPDCRYHTNFGLADLPRFIKQYNVNMNPDYQRDYVWNIEQKKAFVGSAIQMPFNVPVFWFNNTDMEDKDVQSEVVDGKQRMNAILGWLDGQFEAICPCGEIFHVNDIDEIGHRGLDLSTTMSAKFVKLKRNDILKFYLMLNSGGTVHTKEELDRIRGMIK